MADTRLLSTIVATLLMLSFETRFNMVQSDCPPISVGKKDFPNIFDMEAGSIRYVLGVEVTLHDLNSTFSVMEYYDTIDKKGRMEGIDPINGLTSFMYFKETGEAFTVRENLCTTEPVTVTQWFEGLGLHLWRFNKNDDLVLGPSAMFRQAFMNKEYVAFIQDGQEKSKEVKESKADVWEQCIDDGALKLDVKYYFAADIQSETPNLRAIPWRIEITGTNKGSKFRPTISEVYDVIVFESSLPSYMDDPFQVPVGVGCKRKDDSYGNDWIPSLADSDLYIQAEVIFQSNRITESLETYVNNFEVTFDPSSQHLAYTYTPWYQRRNDNEYPTVDFADSMSIIVDATNHYLYQIDRKASLCEVNKFDDFRPAINFPDGTQLDFMVGDILILNDGFMLLGKSEERGFPVRVYEMKSDTFKFSPKDKHDRTVITRYYLDDDILYNTGYGETKVPMKVHIRTFNVTKTGADEEATVDREVIINIFGFTKLLPNKHELFDVRSCFPQPNQARWLQMTFYAPTPDDAASGTWSNLVPEIQENFLKFIRILATLSPLRIPVAMVDFDSPYIVITPLLLDRPQYMLDFKMKGKYALQPNKVSKRVGLTTRDQCAQACLEDHDLIGRCMAFSYCGATCYLAPKDEEAKDLVDDEECKYYSRIVSTGPSTLDDATRLISGSVQAGAVSFGLPYTDKTGHRQVLDIAAVAYEDRVASGVNGLRNRDEELDRHFYTGKSATGFNRYAPNGIIMALANIRSLYECKVACLNRIDCESISFCMQDNECILSSLFGEEINPTHTRTSTQCAIMSRNYLDSFNEFPELTYARKAEQQVAVGSRDDCAKACLKETKFKCLSFDSCPTATDPRQRCLLHSVHFLDMKDNPSNVTHNDACNHFSKNYIYDFKQITEKQIQIDSTAAISLSGLTEEECAKQCIDAADYGCLSFDFCSGSPTDAKSNTCNLVGKYQSDITLLPSTICTYYERIEKIPEKPKLHSEGLAGGLGFLFLVIGTAVGALAAFGYGYMKATR